MALPAATVSKEHPPRLPHNFDWLYDASTHAKVVFRIYDSSSVSPPIWTGFGHTSGFSCPSQNLAGLTPAAYRVPHAEKRGSVEWAEGPYLAQTVVDHILGRWRQTSLNLTALEYQDADIPEDEKSPWISTSKNLSWSIWEIARRLTIQLDKANKNRRSPEGIVVHMSLIKHHSGTVGLNDPRRDYLEAHVDASSPIGNALRCGPGVLSKSIRNSYELALREAKRCKEILYYGRIFVESIDSDTDWTPEVSVPELTMHS